jgi:hypothetical protein
LKINQPTKHTQKIKKALKQLTQVILVTKWKPFEELFKSTTTPGQPNPKNQSNNKKIYELQNVNTHKNFAVVTLLNYNKWPICLLLSQNL